MRTSPSWFAAAALVVGLATSCASVPESSAPAGQGVGGMAATPIPLPRSEVAGAAWSGQLVVAGGFLRDGRSSAQVDTWTSDDGWARLPDLPEPRNHPGLAVLGNRLYLVGGFTQEGRASDRVWSLGADEDRWQVEPALPEPRAAAAVVSDGQRLVVAGGIVGDQVSASVVLFESDAWSSGPAMTAAREHLAGASSGGRVYAIAGRTGGLDGNLDVVESLGRDETAWRPEPSLPRPRGGTSADAVDGVVCVAGGEDPQGT